MNTPPPYAVPADELPAGMTLLLDSWELHLRAEGKSARTIESYLQSARDLAGHLISQGVTDWSDVDRAHVSAWLADLQARVKKSSANNRYRGAQQLFRWLVAEQEIRTHPMDGLKPPRPDDTPPPVVPLEQVKALVKSLAGADYASVRDNAIIRLYLDTGVRRSELAALDVKDIDLREQVATVHGKGSKVRTITFGSRTAQALDRYLRARRRHRHAESPHLWLGERSGPMTPDGIYQMIARRGAAVGLPGLRPHLFRHTAAHEWLANDGSEGDLMRLMGWDSPQMLRRYGASLAAERARKAHRKKALGDRY